MNIIELYEDLRKYIDNEFKYDDLFYNAPEGETQIDIVRSMMEEIYEAI